MLKIDSRNVDGCRVSHVFTSIEEFITDYESDDPQMGDNEILLVVQDGVTVYSSLGTKADRYGDMLRTEDLYDWLLPQWWKEGVK